MRLGSPGRRRRPGADPPRRWAWPCPARAGPSTCSTAADRFGALVSVRGSARAAATAAAVRDVLAGRAIARSSSTATASPPWARCRRACSRRGRPRRCSPPRRRVRAARPAHRPAPTASPPPAPLAARHRRDRAAQGPDHGRGGARRPASAGHRRRRAAGHGRHRRRAHRHHRRAPRAAASTPFERGRRRRVAPRGGAARARARPTGWWPATSPTLLPRGARPSSRRLMARAWAEVSPRRDRRQRRDARAEPARPPRCARWSRPTATATAPRRWPGRPLEAGAAWLAVAQVAEATELRAAGIDAPILLLSEPPRRRGRRGARRRGGASPSTPTTLIRAARRGRRPRGGLPVPVHLKVDTGMHRVGRRARATSSRLAEAVAAAPACARRRSGPTARSPTSPTTRSPPLQLERFDAVVAELERGRHRVPLRHAANSAAAIAHPASRYDLVRCGIAVYGIPPAPALAGRVAAAAGAARWPPRSSFVKPRRRPASGVSYGLRHRCEPTRSSPRCRSATPTACSARSASRARRCSSAAVGARWSGSSRWTSYGRLGPDSEVAAGDEVVLLGARATSGSRPTSGRTARHDRLRDRVRPRPPGRAPLLTPRRLLRRDRGRHHRLRRGDARPAPRRSPPGPPGDLVVLAGDLGAARPRSPRASAAASASTEPITSPTFTLVHVVRGPAAGPPPRRVPARAAAARSLDLGLPEMLDDGGRRARSSGATPSLPRPARRLPRGAPHLRRGRRRPPRRVPPGRAALGAARPTRWPASRRGALERRPDVLILGIDTATAQVGCAVGGHEGVLGVVHSARGRRHAETLTPGHRVRAAARPASSSTRSAPSPSTSARGCSPACGSASPRPRPWPTPSGCR